MTGTSPSSSCSARPTLRRRRLGRRWKKRVGERRDAREGSVLSRFVRRASPPRRAAQPPPASFGRLRVGLRFASAVSDSSLVCVPRHGAKLSAENAKTVVRFKSPQGQPTRTGVRCRTQARRRWRRRVVSRMCSTPTPKGPTTLGTFGLSWTELPRHAPQRITRASRAAAARPIARPPAADARGARPPQPLTDASVARAAAARVLPAYGRRRATGRRGLDGGRVRRGRRVADRPAHDPYDASGGVYHTTCP